MKGGVWEDDLKYTEKQKESIKAKFKEIAEAAYAQGFANGYGEGEYDANNK